MALPPWVSQNSQDNWSTAGQSNPSPSSYTVSDPDNQGS